MSNFHGIIAQGETNNWHFGFGSSIQFNNDGSVMNLQNSSLLAYEGCASISDRNGELLFYTDGETIYNRAHEVMTNGTGLYGNSSSTQSAIIVPLPNSPNLYYVFTTDATILGIRGKGLNYSIVDMSMDSGRGAIIQKNTNLLADCTEKLTSVIKNCTGGSVWVISLSTATGQKVDNPIFNTYHSFELNSDGLIQNSVTSTFNDLFISDDQGYIKLSSDGTVLASANVGSGLYLYDFDKATGRLNNQREIEITAPNTFSYGLEFSLSGRYLYVDTRNNYPPTYIESSNLLQFDLNSNDISASQIILDDRVLFRGALQMGINGKIYRALSDDYFNGLPYLGVINSPESNGLEANYIHEGVFLDNNSAQGLPPFVTSFFNTIDLLENDISNLNLCLGDTLILEAQLIAGATYRWDKNGVPLSFTGNILTIPESTLQDSGDYRVTIVRPNAIDCPVLGETSVNISPLPESANLTLSQCDVEDDKGEDGLTNIDLTQIQNTDGFTYWFYLSQTDRNSDNHISNPETFRNTEPFFQTLIYRVVNENGCEAEGLLELNVYPVPELMLEEEYVFCEGDTGLEIMAPIGFDGYNWYRLEDNLEQLIATGEAIRELDTGTYMLEALQLNGEGPDEIECSRRFVFDVKLSSPAEIVNIIISDNSEINTLEIVATGVGDYEYSIDGTIYQDSNYLDNVPSGSVTVFVRDKNGCAIIEQTVEIDSGVSPDEFPKFFTPNGDGVNDYWNFVQLDTNNDVDISIINIYNRYGQLLAELNPLGRGWDGTFKGRLQPPTDYWYRAFTFDNREIQGHFSLVY